MSLPGYTGDNSDFAKYLLARLTADESNAGTGTVTSVGVTGNNGITASVSSPTTAPAISLGLGAITPTSIASTGAISGTTIAATGAMNTTSTLGYATGAGGAVTQVTSRSTGVALNKASGQITLFSAAGVATYTTFTVTNTLVAATDTIVVNQASGTNLYIIIVTAVAAGSFTISFATTGGTAVDAPVFNFAVIKAVNA